VETFGSDGRIHQNHTNQNTAARPASGRTRTTKGIEMALALDPRYVVEVRTPYRSSVAAPRPMHDVYLRRRIVAGLLVTLLAVAICLGIRSLASRGDGAAPVSAVTPSLTVGGVNVSGAYVVNDGVYIVQPGDTLWSIASSLTDDGIRDYVAELISLNGGASIDVGQRLALPAD
jgi:hypothetical protein